MLIKQWDWLYFLLFDKVIVHLIVCCHIACAKCIWNVANCLIKFLNQQTHKKLITAKLFDITIAPANHINLYQQQWIVHNSNSRTHRSLENYVTAKSLTKDIAQKYTLNTTAVIRGLVTMGFVHAI